MAYPDTNMRRPVEIIDLTSDGLDGGSPNMQSRHPHGQQQNNNDVDYMDLIQTPPLSPRPAPRQNELDPAVLAYQAAQGGFYVEIDGENIFIPDEPAEAVGGAAGPPVADANILNDYEVAMGLQQPDEPMQNFQVDNAGRNEDVERDREIALALENQDVTADMCLQRVLEIFPDISHEHVLKLYEDLGKEGDYETLPGQARVDNIIEQLADSTSYPKQERGKLKRKREPSIDENEAQKYEKQDRIPVPSNLNPQMRSMLKAEFPVVTVQYINDTLKAKRHFYQAYIALAKANDDRDSTARPFGTGRPSKHLTDASTIAMGSGYQPLLDELNAARSKVQSIQKGKALENAKQKAEKENLDKAIAAGATSECSACFDDLPMNRQIHCNGPEAHFTCYDCALTYIKSEVGDSRCRVECPAGCGAAFANDQLNQLSDKQLLEKLAQLQQEKDIREAGLDDLEECPFCDYKEILPPIEEDFEFRCKNPACEQVSCRRCKSVSHIPISCEQHAKDCKGNSRKKVEEAMTAALIRSCTKCKKQFIKESGCNKMRCPSCGNLQCYVCSTSISNYNHFDQSPSGNAQGGPGQKKCPLYDNVEERHEREVKEAEATARADVLRDNPDLSSQDLEIKVSDAVKKADSDRIHRAGPPGGHAVFAGGFVGGDAELMAQALARNRAQDVQDEQAMAHRVRLQQARMQQAHARRVARDAQQNPYAGIGQGLGAQFNAMQNALGIRGQQAQALQAHQQPQQAGGAMGAIQGYIPVIFNPAAGLPGPQVQQNAAGAARQQPQQGQAQPYGGFGVRQDRPEVDFGLPYNFGGDGAADFNAIQQPNQAPLHNNDVNNNNVGVYPAGLKRGNQQIPGGWPNHAQADRVNDFNQQLRDLELQNLRRLEEARTLNRQREQQALQLQAAQARINNRAGNHHYEEYEREMRRTGNHPQW